MDDQILRSVAKLEEQFGCSLPNDKVKKFVTVGDLIDAIKRTKGDWSNTSSYNQQTSREELYRKAQEYIKNNDYSSALQVYKEIATDIEDEWGIFAIYDMYCYSEELKLSHNEIFQLAHEIVDYYDFTEDFDDSIDAHACWRWLLEHVGFFYGLGRGCEANPQKAFEYFHKAALLGLPEAMSDVGFCYLSGKGVEENHKEALYWCVKSKEAGSEDENIDDIISELCDELKVPSSIKSTDPYFSKKCMSEDNTASDLAVLSSSEQEFVNLVKQLSANSALTSKQYAVLGKAGNRLNIPPDRYFELLDIAREW